MAALFGAYVIAFNPWMIYKARDGHIAFTQGWALLLVIGAGIWMIRTRRVLAGVALGSAVGLTFWVASYWGLLGSVIAAVALAYDLVVVRPRIEKLWTATLACAAVGVASLFLVPGALAYLSQKQTVNRSLDNPSSEMQACAARPASYLLPAAGHPLCGRVVRPIAIERREAVNEQTLFFGYTTYLLAAFTLIRRRRGLLDSQIHRLAAGFFGVLAAVAFYFSLPREIHLGIGSVPAPSFFLGHVTSFYRCYARFGYVVGIAVALLAALGLHGLIQRNRRRGLQISCAALVLVVFELLYGWMPAWQSNHPPAYVRGSPRSRRESSPVIRRRRIQAGESCSPSASSITSVFTSTPSTRSSEEVLEAPVRRRFASCPVM